MLDGDFLQDCFCKTGRSSHNFRIYSESLLSNCRKKGFQSVQDSTTTYAEDGHFILFILSLICPNTISRSPYLIYYVIITCLSLIWFSPLTSPIFRLHILLHCHKLLQTTHNYYYLDTNVHIHTYRQ